jgi:cytochrome P450
MVPLQMRKTEFDPEINAKDLLSYMMLQDEDGRRLSHPELFGNVRMFLFAGHDTSAATLRFGD